MPDDDASHGDAALDEAGLEDAHDGAPGDVEGAAASGPDVPDASDARVSTSEPVPNGASGDASAADGSFDGGPDAGDACPDTSTISNADGALTCCSGNPGGTYTTRTRNECAVMSTVLGCSCETDNGGYVASFLALCIGQPLARIANTNGVPTCQ